MPLFRLFGGDPSLHYATRILALFFPRENAGAPRNHVEQKPNERGGADKQPFGSISRNLCLPAARQTAQDESADNKVSPSKRAP